MKVKFKEFIKKIKNWLCSLSKWAKEHKKTLLTVFMLPLVLCMTLGKCSNDNITASAQTISSNSKILYLPEVQFQREEDDFPIVLAPSFIGVVDNNLVVYSANSSNGEVLSYEDFIITDSGGYADISVPLFYQWYLNGVSHYEQFNNSRLGVYFGNKFTSTNFADLLDLIFNRVTSTSIDLSQSGADIIRVSYRFYTDVYKSDLIVQFNFYLSGDLLSAQTYDINTSFFVASDFLIDDYVNSLLGNKYNEGYNNGYVIGYDKGLTDGLESKGYDFSPIGIIAQGINDFLEIPIFGNFSLGSLFAISMGCILFGFAIKMFLGG